MDFKGDRPLRLIGNPFTLWSDAFKTGLAMWATAQATAVRAYTSPIVAVIPTADALAPKAKDAAKLAEVKPAEAPRRARAAVRQASKAVRPKATRAKRSKSTAKRRAKR